MRWLINYLRSCFCKHYWELLTEKDVYQYSSSTRPFKTIYVYRCDKCGQIQKVEVK